MKEVKPKVPMIVRLVGTNAKAGRQILADANMITASIAKKMTIAVMGI